MKRYNLVVLVAIVMLSVTAPLMAQEGGITSFMTADHNMRSSKVIGMAVYNDQGEKIGVVDDILLPVTGGEVTAVLSVGGYLGVGQKMIKVPLSHVQFTSNKPVMPGVNKAAMMAIPSYSYGITSLGGG